MYYFEGYSVLHISCTVMCMAGVRQTIIGCKTTFEKITYCFVVKTHIQLQINSHTRAFNIQKYT